MPFGAATAMGVLKAFGVIVVGAGFSNFGALRTPRHLRQLPDTVMNWLSPQCGQRMVSRSVMPSNSLDTAVSVSTCVDSCAVGRHCGCTHPGTTSCRRSQYRRESSNKAARRGYRPLRSPLRAVCPHEAFRTARSGSLCPYSVILCGTRGHGAKRLWCRKDSQIHPALPPRIHFDSRCLLRLL
jgi:hypothetical protein